MSNNKIIFWASDFSDTSGEGKLARLFISKLKKFNKNDKITLVQSVFIKNNKNINKLFFSSWIHKYFGPIYGIIKLWFFFLQGWKTCYVNYLPLWNFIIFLFLPPKTILGPITGSILKEENVFLKKILEQISIIIIKVRFKNLLFSNNFYQKIFKQSTHNFILADFIIAKIKKKKKYDFIFYIRNEFYKKNIFFQILIKNLLKLNFKIATIGDKIQTDNIVNFGYCDNKKAIRIISLCRYAIGNKENLYSFFVQDCLKHNLTVFYNREFAKFESFKFNNFHPIVFNDHKVALRQILRKIKKKTKTNYFNTMKFDNYFKNII